MEDETTTTEATAGNEGKNSSNIYLGNLKTRTKKKDGSKFLSGTICIDDFNKIPEQFIKEGNNGKRYARVVIEKKLVTDKYNNTHSVKVDTFIPDPNFAAQKNVGDDVI